MGWISLPNKAGKIILDLFFFAIAMIGFIGAGTIYLGYRLIIKGISGGFTFTSELKGMSLALASTSPGLFVVLCGTLICLVSLKFLFKLRKLMLEDGLKL